MSQYKPRLIDKEIKNSLKAYGAINIVGAKWIGKTWTTPSLISKAAFCGLSNDIYTRSDGVIVVPITALKD